MRPFLSHGGRDATSLPSALMPFGPSDSPLSRLRRSLVEVMATGTPDSQARFGQSVKGLLTEKVNTCGTDVIALTKQVLKGSRSSELLGQAARNMVLQEDAILHSEDSLRKMAIITTHLQYQQEAIQKNVEQSSDLQDQLNHLLK
ncbi:BLOC-1-related complex subunit 7 [Canis lupus baileyi]|nr:BLOC-1-related complex subunit 7 isoform X2 [Canis lupus familiaris]XP_535001.4 BLOC-1-related complex subunit 7 isoform X3 [Canis lupus familiaris]